MFARCGFGFGPKILPKKIERGTHYSDSLLVRHTQPKSLGLTCRHWIHLDSTVIRDDVIIHLKAFFWMPKEGCPLFSVLISDAHWLLRDLSLNFLIYFGLFSILWIKMYQILVVLYMQFYCENFLLLSENKWNCANISSN